MASLHGGVRRHEYYPSSVENRWSWVTLQADIFFIGFIAVQAWDMNNKTVLQFLTIHREWNVHHDNGQG